MLTLTIRTDKAEAEIGLYDTNDKIDYVKWEAHRELSTTIHHKIEEMLKKHSHNWPDIQALVIFKGPGSFTGLRIGLAVANTLASGLQIPIVSTMGDDWIDGGLTRIQKGENEGVATAEYGALPNITSPRN